HWARAVRRPRLGALRTRRHRPLDVVRTLSPTTVRSASEGRSLAWGPKPFRLPEGRRGGPEQHSWLALLRSRPAFAVLARRVFALLYALRLPGRLLALSLEGDVDVIDVDDVVIGVEGELVALEGVGALLAVRMAGDDDSFLVVVEDGKIAPTDAVALDDF